jgi:hypothetical protein
MTRHEGVAHRPSVEGDSPFASRLSFAVKTMAEAKDVVDWYAVRGYPH